MPEPRTPEDKELLSAHPGYSEIQDGIDHLDGAGCMPESASAVRLLDAQNDARGREIDRIAAVVARMRDELADRIRHAEDMVELSESCEPRTVSLWNERRRTFADALRLLERLAGAAGDCAEPVSSWWALWSTDDPARLLDLISYDTGPVTVARAREGLGRAVVPLDGRLDAIDQTRLQQLRETHRQAGAQS